MTSWLKKSLVVVWLIVATVTLARTWYLNPNWFPAVPQDFAIWLSNAFHAENAEDQSAVDIWFGLAVSAVIVSAVTFLALYAWRKLRK